MISPFVPEHLCLLSVNFKKEDVARTLLYTMCQELVSTALYACHVTRIKHIFNGGSFIAHALTQRLVMEEFEYRKLLRAASGDVVSAQFLYIVFCHSRCSLKWPHISYQANFIGLVVGLGLCLLNTA